MNELQLRTGAYRTTFIGTEIIRPSTLDEWKNYGEILRRVDEAKQWAIGDWLVDGKRHYADNVYKEAGEILGYQYQTLAKAKRLAELFEINCRQLNLSYEHHVEVSSLKKTAKNEKGKLCLTDKTDMDKMQELLQKAEKENLSTRELADLVKKYKRQQDELIRLSNAPEKYSVFYADPPWKYSDKLIENYGAVEHHYQPMTIQELCNLPIKEITADKAVLFIWVTSPIIQECWDVIRAWGFEYKASFVWDKIKHNYGHYNSVRHELLLICTKDSYLPEMNELPDSVISIERSEKHSEKPEYFRELIEKMYPNSKKIELFAREKFNGWDVFGDEV